MALGAYARSAFGLGFIGPIVAITAVAGVYILIGGARRQYARAVPLAVGAALVTAIIPMATVRASFALLRRTSLELPIWGHAVAILALAVLAGAWVFGAYLALLTRFGIEQTQAFTALDHPGYKHFLRLRVRSDGKGIDAWCIGLTDPVAPNESPVLVDTFSWRPED
jgi:Kef-type K+ transport system membrane component KefB